MMVDLRKRMAELKTAEAVCSKELQPMASIPKEEGFIVLPGETSWQEIIDPVEKHKVYTRQVKRAWRKLHPGEDVELTKNWWQEHPEALETWNSTHVKTNKTPNGRFSEVFAPYKRKNVVACELCRNKPKKLDWHHWITVNPSVGVWTCCECNQFAEAIDAGGQDLVKKYITCKELLDEQYADGKIVAEATIANRRRRLYTTINGVYTGYSAFGKRNRPSGNLCELCDVIKCSVYHHWDDDILGKGLWLCKKCHAFAEKFDQYGESFIEKYLNLKVQDESRVLAVMKADGVEFNAYTLTSTGRQYYKYSRR